MQSCFFDRIGLADMEKVHSAVIANQSQPILQLRPKIVN